VTLKKHTLQEIQKYQIWHMSDASALHQISKDAPNEAKSETSEGRQQ
jgi:hypothetical protein